MAIALTQTVFTTQTRCALPDLPLGETIIITVSARNSTGETPTTRVIISSPLREAPNTVA